MGEFNAIAPINQSEGNLFVIFERKGAEFYLELGRSESGNKTRIRNFFKGFEGKIDEKVKKLVLNFSFHINGSFFNIIVLLT